MHRAIGIILLLALVALLLTAILGHLWSTILSACLVGGAAVLLFLEKKESREIATNMAIDPGLQEVEIKDRESSNKIEELEASLDLWRKNEAITLKATGLFDAVLQKVVCSLPRITSIIPSQLQEMREGLLQVQEAFEVIRVRGAEVSVEKSGPEDQDQTETGDVPHLLHGIGERLQSISDRRDVISSRIKSFAESLEALSTGASEMVDLSEEANVLAINASIEAARLGQPGRGFRVIASSIHEHAERVKEMAVRIRSLVGTEIHVGAALEVAQGLKTLRQIARDVEDAANFLGDNNQGPSTEDPAGKIYWGPEAGSISEMANNSLGVVSKGMDEIQTRIELVERLSQDLLSWQNRAREQIKTDEDRYRKAVRDAEEHIADSG